MNAFFPTNHPTVYHLNEVDLSPFQKVLEE